MKISILGAAGNIGQTVSLFLKIRLPINSELFLYDIHPTIKGIGIDLSHISNKVKIYTFSGTNLINAIKKTNIILITAGIPRKPGMNRNDLFEFNAKIIQNLTEQIAIHSPKAIISIVTNPINSLIPVAAEVLKKHNVYEKNKLFGVTTLDTMRANTFIRELKGESKEKLTIPVIGGHSSNTILPLLSQIKEISFNKQEAQNLIKRIRNAGTEVLEAKQGIGSASLSMGKAAADFVISLTEALEGKKNILEYAYIEGSKQYSRFFTQPFFLGKNGVKELKNIENLNEFEEKELKSILKILKEEITYGEKFIK